MDIKESRTAPNYQPHNTKTSGAITLPQILLLLKRYWYFFLVSVPLSLAVVYAYHRYVTPVYRASATIMYKTQNEGRLTSTALIDGFGLSPEVQDLENQAYILKSYKIVKRTIDKLDFAIEYYSDGRLKDTEMYHATPFKIVIDSGKPQLLDVPIHIKFVGDDRFEVQVAADGGALFNYKTNDFAGTSGPIDINGVFAVGEMVQWPFCAFTLQREPKNFINHQQPYFIKFRSPQAVAHEFKGALGISPYSESSSILFLSISGHTPAKLQTFLDQLCVDLVDYNLEQKNEIANRTMMFIKNQLDVISDTLESTQNHLIAFKKENGLFEPSTTIQKISDAYYDTETKLKFLEMKVEYFRMLDRKLKEQPYGTDFLLPAFSENEYRVVSQMVMEILAQNNEYQAVLSNANVDNPYLEGVKLRIDQARENLLLAIEKTMTSIDLQKDVLLKEMRLYDQQMAILPDVERRYLKLERKYKLNDAIYTFLLQKNSETQITKAGNAPDNEILDNASVSGVISPNKRSNYSRAIMLALALPVAVIVIIEFLNVRVRLKEDLDHLLPEVPMMGIVPRSKNGDNCVLHQPHGDIAESFRTLRTRLNYLTLGSKSRVLTVSSTEAGEGKTFVCLNLATVYAVAGKRTVLIGMDLRKPRLGDLLGVSEAYGVSRFLIGQANYEQILVPTQIKNLTLIPSGEIPPNPSELIASDQMSHLLARLRNDFDVIVIDTPPIGLVSDARLLMSDTDAVLYVVRCNITNKHYLKHTVQNLVAEGVHPIGLIFNDVVNSHKGYGNYSSEYYGKVKG